MLKQQAQQSSDQQAMNKAMMDGQASIIDNLNTQAQTLKILGESMGADAVISQGGVEAYAQQTELVNDQQEEME
jgi:ABC-type hemin transport system substrate-binding protein